MACYYSPAGTMDRSRKVGDFSIDDWMPVGRPAVSAR